MGQRRNYFEIHENESMKKIKLNAQISVSNQRRETITENNLTTDPYHI